MQAMTELAGQHGISGAHAYELELYKKFTGETKITDGRLEHGIYPDDTVTLTVLSNYSGTAGKQSSTRLS